VIGTGFTAAGAEYFNPDEAAKYVRAANPALDDEQANGIAWSLGRQRLERAIAERGRIAFETTLGGNTIPALLQRAIDEGIDVKIKFVGLVSPELHIQRVRARVARGGHDIPEEKIRERYQNSRLNLIRLLPRLAELLVYDNSREADPARGVPPQPVLLLHMKRGRIVKTADLATIPQWAKPILAAAMSLAKRSRRWRPTTSDRRLTTTDHRRNARSTPARHPRHVA